MPGPPRSPSASAPWSSGAGSAASPGAGSAGSEAGERHRGRLETAAMIGRTPRPASLTGSDRGETAAYGQPPHHRRVTEQGAHAQPVPRFRLHHQGLDGPCPRPAQVEARRRPRQGVRPPVRGHQGGADQGAARRGQGRHRGDPRLRPRSRGRGHRLAPRRGAPPQGPSARGLPRDHPRGGRGGAARPPPDRPRPGRRPGGPPGHRPPGRLPAEPLSLEEGAHRPERRPGAVGRGAPGRRPRERDRRLRPRGVVDGRGPAGDRPGGHPHRPALRPARRRRPGRRGGGGGLRQGRRPRGHQAPPARRGGGAESAGRPRRRRGGPPRCRRAAVRGRQGHRPRVRRDRRRTPTPPARCSRTPAPGCGWRRRRACRSPRASTRGSSWAARARSA